MIFGVWLYLFQQLVYAKGRRIAFVGSAVAVLGVFPIAVFASPQTLGIARLLLGLGAAMAAGAVSMGIFTGRLTRLVHSALVPLLLFLLLMLPTYYLPREAWIMLLVFVFVQTPLYLIALRALGVLNQTDGRRIREVLHRLSAALQQK